jgi:tetratricopeptide (TPR) repeat protein
VTAPIASERSDDAAHRPAAWAGLGAVLVVGALLYAGSLGAPFVFDDFPAVVDNALLRAPVDVAALFRYMPARVVATGSFALNLALGDAPASLRVVNVAIHLMTAALVFALVLLLLERTRGSRPVDALLATAACAIFVAHPLQTQAVTYVWQRVASLAGLLYVAALVLHFMAMHRRAEGEPWRGLLAAALAAGLLGMFTKQTVFSLPFAVVALTWATGGRQRLLDERTGWLAWVPMIAIIPLTIVAFGDMQVADIKATGERMRSPVEYFLTQWQVIALYWRLTFVPVGQSLIHDLPTGSLSSWTTWASGLLHVVVIAGAVVVRRRLPLLTAGVLLFYVALAVESSFVPLADEAFEHRLYVALAGVALALIGLADARIDAKQPRWATEAARAPLLLVAVGLAVAAPLGLLTLQRNAVWSDPVALWRESAERAPGSYTARLNAGIVLIRAEQAAAAVPHLQAAHRLRPQETAAALELGAALCLADRCDEGMEILKAAHEAAPTELTRSQLVTALAQQGHFAEAADLLATNPPTGPRGAALYAKVLMDAGRAHQAAEHLSLVIASAPPAAAASEQMRALKALLAEAQRAASPTPRDDEASAP